MFACLHSILERYLEKRVNILPENILLIARIIDFLYKRFIIDE